MEPRTLRERLVAELQHVLPAHRMLRRRREDVELDRLPRHPVQAQQQRSVFFVVPLGEAARNDLDRAVVELGEDRREGEDLFGGGVVRRHLAPVIPHVDVDLRGRKPDGPLPHRSPDELLHLLDLVVGRSPFGGIVTEDPPANSAMADVPAGVHTEPSLEATPELTEAPAGTA